MKNKFFQIIGALFFASVAVYSLFFAEKTPDAKINGVKNATLSGYEKMTLGAAIESVFGNVKWRYYKTEKGVKIVEASGELGEATVYYFSDLYGERRYYNKLNDDLSKMSEYEIQELSEYCKRTKIVLQFTLHADEDQFEFTDCHIGTSFVEVNRIIDHIYSNDVRYVAPKNSCNDVEKLVLTEKEETKNASNQVVEDNETINLDEENFNENIVDETVNESEMGDNVDLQIGNSSPEFEVLKDSRDGKEYKTVKIGSQIWMAENLNYETNDSYDSYYLHDEFHDLPEEFGRFYKWNDAKNVCPTGWRLPSNEDFETLMASAGGVYSEIPGEYFLEKSLNAYGFSVQSVGFFNYHASYVVDEFAYFWSSNEDDLENAYFWVMTEHYASTPHVGVKDFGFSVRCVLNADN